MVEGAITNCTPGLALDSLSGGLARMDAEVFLDASQRVPSPPRMKWVWAILETTLGATLLWVVARSIPHGKPFCEGGQACRV